MELAAGRSSKESSSGRGGGGSDSGRYSSRSEREKGGGSAGGGGGRDYAREGGGGGGRSGGGDRDRDRDRRGGGEKQRRKGGSGDSSRGGSGSSRGYSDRREEKGYRYSSHRDRSSRWVGVNLHSFVGKRRGPTSCRVSLAILRRSLRVCVCRQQHRSNAWQQIMREGSALQLCNRAEIRHKPYYFDKDRRATC